MFQVVVSSKDIQVNADVFFLVNFRMKEAIEIYKTALKYEPDNADVYYNVCFITVTLLAFLTFLNTYCLISLPYHRI